MQATSHAPDTGTTGLLDLAGAAAALRDIGPDLHAAVLEAMRRIDAVAAASEAQRVELAALGTKVNALLDRGEPAPLQLTGQLARHDERLAAIHDLLERLHAVTVAAPAPAPPPVDQVVRRDVSLVVDVVAGLADRVEHLAERIEAIAAARRPEPIEQRLAELVEVVRKLDGSRLGPLAGEVRDLRAEVAGGLAALRDAEPPPVDAQPVVAALRTQLEGVRLSVDTDDLTERLTGRTEAALAALLRLVDERLERLGADDLADAVRDIGDSLAGVAMRQEELRSLVVDLGGDALTSEAVGRQLEDLGRQLAAFAGRLDATLAELERRQPVVTADQLRRAAASVREAVAATRRPRR